MFVIIFSKHNASTTKQNLESELITTNSILRLQGLQWQIKFIAKVYGLFNFPLHRLDNCRMVINQKEG